MKVEKVTRKVAGKQSETPQLLDTKSDYNNYSNLSYFISQYKRAVEIINECETFYSNFLRSKLFTYEQIKKTPGINMLNMRFSLAEYKVNADRLYKYFVYKKISEEFTKRLTKYQYKPVLSDVYGHCGEVLSKEFKGEYTIVPVGIGIPMPEDYFQWLVDTFCIHCEYPVRICKDESKYTWNDRFLDKVYAKSNGDKGPTKWTINGFRETGENKGKISIGNDKYIDVKTTKIERFVCDDYARKQKYKSTGEFDTFVIFGKEELEMIKILQEFRKKYGEKIKNDIYLHPSKYIDLWKEYTKNKKDPGTYYVQHKCDDRGKDISHKNMFAPVDYTIEPSGYYTKSGGKRGKTYDKVSGMTYFKADEDDKYVVGDYTIDGVMFLNEEVLSDKDKNTFFCGEWLMGKCDSDDGYINKLKLQRQIESIQPKSHNACNKNIDNLISKDWYYILIDNTPYKFTNSLSSVDIEYDEYENKLVCDYAYKTRVQKWRWPSDSPYTVTDYHYKLIFDCSTNEPIYYENTHHSYEEKIRRSY